MALMMIETRNARVMIKFTRPIYLYVGDWIAIAVMLAVSIGMVLTLRS
jgi:hypothetical protein